jgi:hypothetical protein
VTGADIFSHVVVCSQTASLGGMSQTWPLLSDDARQWLRSALELVAPRHRWMIARGVYRCHRSNCDGGYAQDSCSGEIEERRMGPMLVPG